MPPPLRLSTTAEHLALAEAVAGVADRADLRGQTRLAHDREPDELPAGWKDLAAAEVLAVAMDGDLLDAAVVAAELGRTLAPGPVAATLAAAHLARRFAPAPLGDQIAAGLRDGGFAAAVDIGDGLLAGGAAVSHVLRETPRGWRLAERDGIDLEAGPGADPSWRAARIRSDTGGGEPLIDVDRATVTATVTALLAAEAAGIAAWCATAAADYARVREQFGRPIGAFQAVKHRCADLYCGAELALAVSWDGAAAVAGWLRGDVEPREAQLAVAAAIATAAPQAVTAATGLIQVLGGIGYTWEHDAHLYLKRALAIRQLLGGADRWRRRVAELAVEGVRRRHVVDLGPGSDSVRAEVRRFLETVRELNDQERRRAIVDAGYLMPHWPSPFGRDAGPVEQLVIDEEFKRAGVSRPDLVIGAWAVSTILAHGSPSQRERFVRPTMLGELTWCQLFSEPGAGSDLASLSTRATRAPGGWTLTGQKVWTSNARTADWAIALARTSQHPDRHRGITFFLVDMASPGIDIRPLRELTGEALFNEIFLDEVFVPDDCVVGEVDDGWRLARTTLANERVAMSSGEAFSSGVEELLQAVAHEVDVRDPAAMVRVGELVSRAHADAMLGLRSTLARVSGIDPGPVSSIRKLIGMHLRQDAAELALDLLGPAAVTLPDPQSRQAWHVLLASRALTIAGGTSEILRNVIGERILGLPRG